MHIIITDYQEEDFNEVWSLRDLNLKASGVKERPGQFDMLKSIEKNYQTGRACFLVAKHNNKVLGMGALSQVDEISCVLSYMRVNQKYWRKGIGTKILKYLEKRAQELDYSIVTLGTTNSKERTLAFYQKNGYQIADEDHTKWGGGVIQYILRKLIKQ